MSGMHVLELLINKTSMNFVFITSISQREKRKKYMKMAACYLVLCFVFLTGISTSASTNNVSGAPSTSPLPSFSAIFVFGDSLLDNGNNNKLFPAAKANFWPYGIDSPWGPTGRFSNGKLFIDLLGFSVVDRPCCGFGMIGCLRGSWPCTSRDEYVFWDPYHPTEAEAVNRVLASKAFNGSTSDCFPFNVLTMARM